MTRAVVQGERAAMHAGNKHTSNVDWFRLGNQLLAHFLREAGKRRAARALSLKQHKQKRKNKKRKKTYVRVREHNMVHVILKQESSVCRRIVLYQK